MNVLIIGFGSAGKYYFELLKNNKKIKKIFIYDENKKIIDNDLFLDFKNKNTLIENKISHGIIATPSHLHFKYAKYLIDNKINLLIEKPMVLNLNNAKKLIKISKQTNKKCWVVFQNRYNTALQNLKKEINKKNMNKVFYVDAKMYWCREDKYYKSNWHGKYSSDGGVLTNQAIHLLDSLVYLFGKVIKFNSILSFNKKKLEAEDLVILNMKHKNGIVSSLAATTRADKNYECSIDVILKNKRLAVSGISLNDYKDYSNDKSKIDPKKSEIFSGSKGIYGAMGTGHHKILSEFLSFSNKKSSKDLELYKNLHVLEILHSVYKDYKKDRMKNIESKQSVLGKNEK